MSLYGESVKKTFLIGEDQNRRLKNFCQANKISASQLLRLFIDELRVTQYDTLRSMTEECAFKTQNFVGAYDGQEPIKEVILDEKNGRKQARWMKVMQWR